MVNLSIDELDIAEPVEIGPDKWYTIVGFGIAETTTSFGIFKRKFAYNETLLLLVTSAGFDKKPDIEDITQERFDKRIIQNELNASKVKKYINEKIQEASELRDSDEAFKYLERYFINSDEEHKMN